MEDIMIGMRDKLLQALRLKHEALMETALVNIEVYENAVGIGEHPDIIEAVESQVKQYVESAEIVDGIDRIINL